MICWLVEGAVGRGFRGNKNTFEWIIVAAERWVHGGLLLSSLYFGVFEIFFLSKIVKN